uniref:ATPase SWSAP1 n=1 Tax=Pristiophorus japonicus TaxID=55135 RepID=UPI00398E60D8
MAGILLTVLSAGAARAADLTGEWDTAQLGKACLLLGEPSCGKSSLLFLAAASQAGQEGGRVLFLAPSAIQALPAPLLRLEPRSLRRIQFAYPSSAEELLEALASLHQSPAVLPSLILLDGLEHYLQAGCGQDSASQAALIAALLWDSAAWLSEKLRPNAECQVIVTFKTLTQDETAADQNLRIIERYFPLKCVVREEPCELEGAQSFYISFTGSVRNEPPETCASQSVEDCTWELIYEADNVRIHPVTREPRESEGTPDAWGLGEGTSNNLLS